MTATVTKRTEVCHKVNTRHGASLAFWRKQPSSKRGLPRALRLLSFPKSWRVERLKVSTHRFTVEGILRCQTSPPKTGKMVSESTLAKDINFIQTPAAQPSSFEQQDCNVPVTNVSRHVTLLQWHYC